MANKAAQHIPLLGEVHAHRSGDVQDVERANLRIRTPFIHFPKHAMAPKYECVLPTALQIPAMNKLAGKRVILASASPRRREILKTFVGHHLIRVPNLSPDILKVETIRSQRVSCPKSLYPNLRRTCPRIPFLMFTSIQWRQLPRRFVSRPCVVCISWLRLCDNFPA
jgi:hypothetical protein